MESARGLDALQDGDDAIGLHADRVQSRHQGAKVRAIDDRHLSAVDTGSDIGERLNGGNAAGERGRLHHRRCFVDLHGERAVADGDLGDPDVIADDDGSGTLVDHNACGRVGFDDEVLELGRQSRQIGAVGLAHGHRG